MPATVVQGPSGDGPRPSESYTGADARERMHLDRFVGRLGRFVLAWLVDTLSLLVVARLLGGVNLVPPPGSGTFLVAASVALVLGVANAILRPILVMLAMPLNAVTVGFSSLFINAIVLLAVAWIYPFLEVSSFLEAVLASIVLGVANAFLTGFLPLSDDDSIYQQFISRRALKDVPATASMPGRGIVCMEIDGLAFPAIKRAIDKGLMPHVAGLLQSGSHVLSHIDCGLPSMTSSCQTGILFGKNDDIPAFRWYEKSEGRMFVSNKGPDAASMEARLSNGDGLLVGGSSFVNNQTGDAAKAFLVFSALKPRNDEEKRLRERDMYLYSLNPYFFTRTFAGALWDFVIEAGQMIRQRLRNVEPRINRLEKGYPFIRPGTTVLMRDLSTYLLTLDIRRGAPAMYATYLGYDEVAHHAGPGRRDAEMTLPGLDEEVGKLLAAIDQSPRRYDFFLLSDHGQSLGETFKDRYGETLADLITRLTSTEAMTAAAEATAGEGATYVGALLTELSGGKGITARAVGGMSKSLGSGIAERDADTTEGVDPSGKVVVAVSGNLGNVYFVSGPARKLTQAEIESAHPGLIAELVEHAGIGLVVVHNEDGSSSVLGKSGGRNLTTGQVAGEDPLPPYGDAELRARQIGRLAGFNNAGDIVLISTLYPDGQVAAFEELVGSHGGLGGEQTDAFLMHPSDMVVPPTENSTDVFPLLKARRELSGERPPPPEDLEMREVGSWQVSNLVAGLTRWQLWLRRAGECVLLQRDAYRAVANQTFYTGPALLLAVIGSVVTGVISQRYTGSSGLGMVGNIVGGVIGLVALIMALHFAARGLGGRGTFTATFRAVGFAETISLVGLVGVFPTLTPVAYPLQLLIKVVGAWIGVQEAHRLHGRRSILLPVVAILVIVVVAMVALFVAGGLAFTVSALLKGLGVTTPQ